MTQHPGPFPIRGSPQFTDVFVEVARSDGTTAIGELVPNCWAALDIIVGRSAHSIGLTVTISCGFDFIEGRFRRVVFEYKAPSATQRDDAQQRDDQALV